MDVMTGAAGEDSAHFPRSRLVCLALNVKRLQLLLAL